MAKYRPMKRPKKHREYPYNDTRFGIWLDLYEWIKKMLLRLFK
jgi:hypothetical protein